MSDTNFIRRWADKALSRLEGGTYVASPRSAENGGWPETHPFSAVWSNGAFQSAVDGTIEVFFRAPTSVRTEWLGSRNELIREQMFFNYIVEDLAAKLNTGTMSRTRDLRREFRMNFVRSKYKQLYRDEHDTPATVDYRDRMGENIWRPEWSGYIGVQLLPTNIMEESANIQEFRQALSERYRDPFRFYLDDYRQVKTIMEEHGCVPLTNFTVDSEDYRNLTCWHGVDVEPYRAYRSLETTRFQEPVDGYSLITPAWGEVSFYAAVPMKQRADFGEDPITERAQWGKELFNPSNDVVGVWIKGEIRGREVIKEILNTKSLGRRESLDKIDATKYAEVERAYRDLMVTEQGEQAAEYNDFLDNMEILVCVQNFVGENNPLKKHLRAYGMDALLPVNRQAECLVATIPGSRKQISRMKGRRQSNLSRGQFSCQAFPGALSMSGVLRRTKPCADNGILIGLTDNDNERREVFTTVEAAKEHSASPIMSITGRPGSGKALDVATRVVTPGGGTIRVGDICAGDVVCDGDGQPCHVTYVTDVVQSRRLFRFVTSGGEFLCDDNHQWPVLGVEDTTPYVRLLTAEAERHRPGRLMDAAGIARIANDACGTRWFTPGGVPDMLSFVGCPVADGRWDVRSALWSLARRCEETGRLRTRSGAAFAKLSTLDVARMLEAGGSVTLAPVGDADPVAVTGVVEQPWSRPVRCLSVDSPGRCYLLEGGVPSGNTQSALQYVAQAVYAGYPVVMLNPKPGATLESFFDHLDGVVIRMNDTYLEENPGMLDPFSFFSERKRIGRVLSDAILQAAGLGTGGGFDTRMLSTDLSANIMDNVLDARNTSSYDVVFGNRVGRSMYYDLIRQLREWHRQDPARYPDDAVDGSLTDDQRSWIRERVSNAGGTCPVFNKSVRDFMFNQIKASAFWKTILSENSHGASDIRDKLMEGRPVLIEWDGTLQIPEQDLDVKDYQPKHVDSVISVSLAFQYAETMITRRRTGGVLLVDEAWVLKGSTETMNILNHIGREGRQTNIMPILITQKIGDFLGSGDDSMRAMISRFLFMATPRNDERERELFFELSGLENTDGHWEYMANAGVTNPGGDEISNPIARGFYKDEIFGFSSGVAMGPWPARELTLGRTDKAGEELREKMLTKGEDAITDEEWQEASVILSPEDFLAVVRHDDVTPPQGGEVTYTRPPKDDVMWSQGSWDWGEANNGKYMSEETILRRR